MLSWPKAVIGDHDGKFAKTRGWVAGVVCRCARAKLAQQPPCRPLHALAALGLRSTDEPLRRIKAPPKRPNDLANRPGPPKSGLSAHQAHQKQPPEAWEKGHRANQRCLAVRRPSCKKAEGQWPPRIPSPSIHHIPFSNIPLSRSTYRIALIATRSVPSIYLRTPSA